MEEVEIDCTYCDYFQVVMITGSGREEISDFCWKHKKCLQEPFEKCDEFDQK